MTKIMHLSDLHLGNDIVLRSIIRGRAWWTHLQPSITEGIVSSIRDLSPDVIIISGDIVNNPSIGSFKKAAEYLRKLFTNAGFDIRERVLVVPGNHDASFAPRKNPEAQERLSGYRMFLKELYAESDLESRSHRYVHVLPEKRILFACLDSTLKNQKPLAEGEIGVTQRNWLKGECQKLAGQLNHDFHKYTKVAVFHHHCVPISGTSSGSERFMTLLDAGDILKLLDELGFHMVLHGHKHVPHSYPRIRSDSSVLTIVGAGTATCTFLDEQQQCGNNFNLIRVVPERNEVFVQLFKADQSGTFGASTGEKRFPLFRVAALGYSAAGIRKIIRVQADGSALISVWKEGLRIEEPGKTIRSLPVRIVAPAAGARIRDLRGESSAAALEVVASGEQIIEGSWRLIQPMIYGGEPIDLGYSYRVEGGTAMSKSEYEQMYSSGHPEESTEVVVTHATECLMIEIFFPTNPKLFKTKPIIKVHHLGGQISIENLHSGCKLDEPSNRFEMHVDNPPLDHTFGVFWPLPDQW